MGHGIPGGPLVGVHVLVIDDSEDSRDLFVSVLQYAGALVSVAESADQALRVLDRVLPDVVVTDIAMPGHDGYWLIAQLRKRDARTGNGVPVVAVTAHAERHPSQFASAGFRGHLRKPVDPDELCRLIEGLVRRRA
ncbi:MAG TPA: response regulator [Methylomirabilota bacterium]|nr:response regulator [Methylomirabilota bacterium]